MYCDDDISAFEAYLAIYFSTVVLLTIAEKSVLALQIAVTIGLYLQYKLYLLNNIQLMCAFVSLTLTAVYMHHS